jgi:class 3 adenylate cyclase/tetratricopeptide (TPR) repeat protein
MGAGFNLPEGRRHRALLITDIVGSTEHLARLGDARWRELLEAHERIVAEEVELGGGRIVEDRGDGYLIEFDFSSNAVACAEAVCAATATLGVELRAGVHAGECELLGTRLAGMALHITARLTDLAGPSQVLVSSTVRDQIDGAAGPMRDRGTHELRGVPGRWAVYELQSDRLSSIAGTVRPRLPASIRVPLPLRIASRLTDAQLVDRRSEMAACRRALARVGAGEHRTVLITGEPGIGKTRLAAEIAGDAHADGATVLCGRCDAELALPYQPFVEALTHYARFAPQSLLADHRAQFGNELARLVPELRGAPSAPAEESRADHRYLMFASVAGLLRAASLQQPLVLVLDDLQWADDATLMLVKYLLVSPQLRALVIVTYRSTETASYPALSELLSELRREPGIDSLELGGLEGSDVVVLAESVTEESFDPAGVKLMEALGEETRGNPFFLGEILRALKESGGIAKLLADGRSLAKLDIPRSVVDAINQRVVHLGERTETAMRAAAVIGREFELELLALMLDQPVEDLSEALDAAVEASLLAIEPGFGIGYSFVHPLIAPTLYEQLRGTQRRQLHRRALEGLERLLSDDALHQRSGELAHHALQAVPLVAASKAVEHAGMAGRYALEQLAPQEASRWFGHALELHRPPSGDGPPDDRDDPLLRDLLIGQGIAQQQGGDPEFRATLLRAAELSRAAGDTTRLVRAVLANTRGFVSETGKVDTERVELLDAALEAIGDRDSRERARLLATLAAELTFAGDWPRRKALTDESVAIADRLGDPETTSEVLSARFITYWTPETLAQRVADTTRELVLAEEIGDPLARFRALHWRAAAAVEAGDLDVAQSLVEREATVAKRLSQPTADWMVAYDRATQALMKGLLDEAERWAEDAGRIASASGEPEAAAFYAGQLINIRFEQGRLGELEPLIAAQAEANPGIPAFRAALTLARCEAGIFAQAAEAMAADSADGFAAMPYDSNWLCGIAIFAEACAQVAEARAAGALHRLLAPWRKHIAFNSATTWGPVERHVGNLERVLGRLDVAQESLVRAAELCELIGAPIWLARTRVDLARVLLELGAPVERPETLLQQALGTAVDLGCAGIERQATALLVSVRATP